MHGEPSWCYLYCHIVPALVAKGRRVLAPDLVGFGKAVRPCSRKKVPGTRGRRTAPSRARTSSRKARRRRSCSRSTPWSTLRPPEDPPMNVINRVQPSADPAAAFFGTTEDGPFVMVNRLNSSPAAFTCAPPRHEPSQRLRGIRACPSNAPKGARSRRKAQP